MAKRLNMVNFVYTGIGLAIVGGVTYYAVRRYRQGRLGIEGQASTGFGQDATSDSLMDLRRSSRKAGRAVKDTASDIGKAVKRGASDVGDSLQDANSSGQELIEQETGFKKKY